MAVRTTPPKFGEQARAALNALFAAAHERSPFSFLCTMLRVEPASEEEWDPLTESHAALTQYATQIQARPGGASLTALEDRRLAVLIYCHLTEVAAVYQLLANAMRCAEGKPYRTDPFRDLSTPDVRPPLRRPPTPAQMIARLEDLEPVPRNLLPLLDSFFDPDLRDAFYRSEYFLTKDSLRYRTVAGPIRTLAWADAEDLVRRAMAFYNAFFGEFFLWMQKLGKMPRQEKLEGGIEVELLDAADGTLCGIQWMREDGMPCSFLRLHGAVSCNGIVFSPAGEIVRE